MPPARTENDLLGEIAVPAEALYGAHTVRALENFPLAGRPVHRELVHAYGSVKLACARTNHELGLWEEPKAAAILQACEEMARGELDAHVVVDALQGGAGTSTNMNVNEVLANRALQLLGQPFGDYAVVSPADDINRHQSTNDTYPTALRVAAIRMLQELERRLVALVAAFQAKEKEFASIVKLGRTEMQDAVLTTLGREMSAYAEALSRDRWRLYKCQERLRVVNLGGTAIGTTLGAPRQYVFRVVENLRDITGLGLARAEDLVEATQNWDAFVEVSGMLKTCATNLLKISGDLRLLSSGPCGGLGEIRLPPRQAGSSIMPGKINPVIPEAVSQAAMTVLANDQAITTAGALGSLELNPFAPLIADKLLENLTLLTQSCDILNRLCVAGLTADVAHCGAQVENSTSVATALVEKLGYEKASDIASTAAASGRTVRQIVIERGVMTDQEFDDAISPDQIMRLGHNGQSA